MRTQVLANVTVRTNREIYPDSLPKKGTPISTKLPKRTETVILSKGFYNTCCPNTTAICKTTTTAKTAFNPVNPAWKERYDDAFLQPLLRWKILSG